MSVPRILIAGLRGGSGKTLVSLGLVAAWRKEGRSVAPYKKGPDYIDAAWLSATAATPCRNLDLFLMSPEAALRSFVDSSAQADVAVIEGNRGLYDGMDAQGSYSTAEMAKLLRAPVVLTVDCSKTTRTVAALVLGCQHLDPDVPLRGVILNQVAGTRHEAVLRESIEQICGLPVLGAVRRMPKQFFPERHLGLVPPQEHGEQTSSIEQVAGVAEQYLDLDAIWEVARGAELLEIPEHAREAASERGEAGPPPVARIGIFRDAAFQFYYPENLEALTREGADLVEITPLSDQELPDVDALYIGGGFPETLALRLADNERFRVSLREAIEGGLPVYAECGGAVYLGEKLLYEEKEYPMVGVLPVVFEFQKKPRGHGYVELETVGANPYFPEGASLRGHEFHYTYTETPISEYLSYAFRVRRGYGFDGQRDGLCYRNVLASYTHLHALGTESWAPAVVQAAVQSKRGR
jgi:cobyrinic acid a,c-diamide synthase